MIITLCGSTKFKDKFELYQKLLTIAGHIVLTVGWFGHSDDDPPSVEEKVRLDALHFQKIDMSGAILVLNVGDYIGDSTAAEVEHAKVIGVPIYWLVTSGDANAMNWREIPGMDG